MLFDNILYTEISMTEKLKSKNIVRVSDWQVFDQLK